MTEIERIKKIIESAVTVFVGQDENEQGLLIPKQSLFHLITTIESQNRTIKTYEEVQQGWIDSHAKNFKQIESQKEEISVLRDREYNHYPVVILDLETRIFKLQEEIEGYKAITELAVKGLQNELYWATRLNHIESVKRLAPIISEIERLTHE